MESAMNTRTSRFFITALLCCGLALPITASAGGVTAKQQITKLGMMADGSVRVSAAKPWTNKDNCQNTSYAVLPVKAARFDRIYAMLLLSHAEGAPVTLIVKGCTRVAGKSRPVIKGLYMY